MTDSPDDRPADPLEVQLEALRDHLEATAELPIDPKTNRWLGEAEAVARDAAQNDVDPATARERVGQVQRLLSAADEPDHEEAAAHLEAARDLCRDVLST
ncbi:hypothetical protein [Natronococcus wangiae]|uniref:hypothetical protein n=1 Tax=Natronococcus wangiae TaxID=3068275 RepID=UPI00273E128D|nr:hypothetical protein [Natronococcus sp. AD5]